MLNYAVIRYSHTSDNHEVLSNHRTKENAEKAWRKLANPRDCYIAHRKADGEFDRRLEARDRQELGL